MGSDITLTSTTDSLEQVQDALKIPPDQRVAAVEPPVGTPPAEPPAPATEPPAPAAAAPAATEPPAPAAAAPAGDDDDDIDDTTPPADQTPQQRQRRNRVQQRISELVRERDTARGLSAAKDAELEALRNRLGELTSGKPAAGTETTPPAADAPVEKPKPVPGSFATYEEYTEAMAEWKAEKIAGDRIAAAVKAERDRADKDRQTAARDEAGRRYTESVATVRTKYDDYDEVVGRDDIPISATMQHGMLTSPLGAEIAYYLGKHPDECQKVFEQGDTPMALRAFGRLEAKVEAELERQKKAAEAAPAAPAAEPAKPAAPGTTTLAAAGAVTTPPRDPGTGRFTSPARAVTKAPDPITPVGGGNPGDTTSVVDPSTMSYQDYKKYRNQQDLAKKGLR